MVGGMASIESFRCKGCTYMACEDVTLPLENVPLIELL
jgi:hypothetical protein